MCGSMVDVQSPTIEIRRGKKEKKIEITGKNIMVCPIIHMATIISWLLFMAHGVYGAPLGGYLIVISSRPLA